MEADAREVLPYKFDSCTNFFGPMRQTLFACLTCSPPPASAAQVYTPAGICYACSIACHGDHDLVELFSRRNFVCDCGTTRMPSTSKCTLRSDATTGEKGVASQEAAVPFAYHLVRHAHYGQIHSLERKGFILSRLLQATTTITISRTVFVHAMRSMRWKKRGVPCSNVWDWERLLLVAVEKIGTIRSV